MTISFFLLYFAGQGEAYLYFISSSVTRPISTVFHRPKEGIFQLYFAKRISFPIL